MEFSRDQPELRAAMALEGALTRAIRYQVRAFEFAFVKAKVFEYIMHLIPSSSRDFMQQAVNVLSTYVTALCTEKYKHFKRIFIFERCIPYK